MEKLTVGNDGQDGTSHNGSADAVRRMRRAVTFASTVDGPESHAELDAAARALVAELRRANLPPEQAVLQVKQILAEAGLRPTQGPADSALLIERHVVLYRTVIDASIRHYFHDGRPSDHDRPTETPRGT